MPPLFVAMKILKYTFKIPNLEVIDGDLVENGVTEETYTFTLLHKGIGIFEELSNQPLMAYLYDIKDIDSTESISKVMSKDFIPNLACASYCKIEDGKFHNNRATAEEFRKLPAFQKTSDDINFAMELLQMATDCLVEKSKEENKTKTNVNQKKV